jgi:phosphatidylserine/phosphatidylglycerophosphate/cardiolipin synthase-like enzyme
MSTHLKTLKASGGDIRLVNGRDIQTEYSAAGRSCPPGRGIMHSKSLLVSDRADFSGENYVIVGSCNWTISSLCNVETSVLLQLTQKAATDWKDLVLGWPYVKLTAELEREVELQKDRRSDRRSRTNSPSRPSP